MRKAIEPAAELLALLGAVLVLAALLEALHGLVEPGVHLGVVARRLASPSGVKKTLQKPSTSSW